MNRRSFSMTGSVPTLLLLVSVAMAQAPHLVFSHGVATDGQRWMNFVAISSDGRTVAADGNTPAGEAGALGLWTFPEGEYLRSIVGTPSAISSDFRYFATETGVQEVETGENIFQISGQPYIFRRAAFSPSGEYVALVAGGNGGNGKRPQIIVLKTADGSLTSSFGTRHTKAVAFHPDNQILASGHWNNVTVWEVRTGARLALLMSPRRTIDPTAYNREGRYISGLGFSRDGRMLAAGSDDGELQIWDVTTRKLMHSLKIGFGETSNPAFNPDGNLVAAGTYEDGTVSLVDVSSGKLLSQLQVSMFGCGSVAFSPDGQYLITPSNGGLLKNGKHERGGGIRVFRLVQ
jgi:WD40 repeat protein